MRRKGLWKELFWTDPVTPYSLSPFTTPGGEEKDIENLGLKDRSCD